MIYLFFLFGAFFAITENNVLSSCFTKKKSALLITFSCLFIYIGPKVRIGLNNNIDKIAKQ